MDDQEIINKSTTRQKTRQDTYLSYTVYYYTGINNSRNVCSESNDDSHFVNVHYEKLGVNLVPS